MIARRILSVVLLAFVGVSVVVLIVDEWRGGNIAASSTPSGSDTPGDQADAEGHKVIAYYFHQTKRCKTCLAMQRLSRDALEDAFPEALASGKLEWRVVNVEEPQHRSLGMEYEVISSSLVLVELVDGKRTRFNNLTDIWDLVGNELNFKAYVEGEAFEYVELGP